MKLNNGTELEVLGEVVVEGKTKFITKLDSSMYVKGALVRYVMLDPHEFEEVVLKARKDSEELVVKPTEETEEKAE